MNWYLITNIIGALMVLALILIALGMEKWTWRGISIKHIAITGVLVAVAVVLTNLVSYNLPILPGGVRLALGDWILFLLGAMFGPLIGVIGAICADTLGTLVNIGGTYHIGFMFDKALLALFGALVFAFHKNNLVTLKIIGCYFIAFFIESLICNPIWLYALGWNDAIFVGMVTKIIKFPVGLALYVLFVCVSLGSLKPILLRWQASTPVWCLRNGLFWQIDELKLKRTQRKLRKKGGIIDEEIKS